MSYEAIDDILKCLQEVENQGQFSETEENHMEDLKFLIRYVRIHVKWKTSFSRSNIQNWVQDVDMRLIQPTRNGIMAADVLEVTLLSLLKNNSIKEDLCSQCSCYYQDKLYGRFFAYKDVLIDELVMDCLDPLLENLKHLIRLNDLNLLAVSNGKIKDLDEKLMSIRNFLEITGKEFETKNNTTPRQELLHKTSEDLLTRVKFLIENAIYLSYKLWMQRKIFSMDKFVYDLLVKINHIEPEIRMISFQFLKASETAYSGTLRIDLQALVSVDSLLGNLEGHFEDSNDASIIPLDTHQLACLHQELSFLRYFLMDPHLKQYTEHEPDFNSLLMQVEAMAREAASLGRSICDDQKKDDMAEQMNLMHSNLLEIVNLLKVKIRQMYLRVPKPSASNFPRTPNLGFLDFFMQNLEELLKYRADSIAYVKNEIENVLSELALLSSFIRDTIENTEEDKHIVRLVMDVAYEAERVIDLISASHIPNWYYMLWLSDVNEKIKYLRTESREVYSKKTCDFNVLNVEKASIHNAQLNYNMVAHENVVGLKNDTEEIINQLTGGSKHLDIVSIVGMPGLGKTTLAKKVYEHPSVTLYFPVRSWYCISQVYKRQDLLLSILGDVTELDEEILKMNDDDMDLLLYRSLERKKYLIVIDDIWSIEPWNDICNSFPDDHNGSRILFTSRIKEVALQANPRNPPHFLRLLADDESWELLLKKSFMQKRECPLRLDLIGKKIARTCRGLPFSLVVIAGVLKKLEESADHWIQVLQQLDELVFEDYSTACSYILELSYKHLPDHLKPCLLYLGAFPEDSEIPTWKLIRLWIAEGFVQRNKFESLENVAEGYLMDLIERNLVLISQNKSKGGVKSCHVHDLQHEFCLKKAADENFLLISKDMVGFEQYRRSFYWQQNTLYGWMPYDPYIRSLFFFPTERPFDLFCDLSVLSYVLKLIRVLDLERLPLSADKFPTEIELLVHLRYLAIGGELDHLPSSVGNLRRLETLLVMGTKGEVKLPESLLRMAHLKHVYVRNWGAFELSDTFQLEKSFESHCIETLSTLSLRLGDGTLEKIFRRLRSLRKLKCILLESLDYNWESNLFPVLDLLSELESLNMSYRGSMGVLHLFEASLGSPSKLKKLTLSNFRLPWSEISKIGRLLPQLEVLKLLSEACEGKIWEVSDGEFWKLKFLKLQNLDIVEWHASDDDFPCLEQLVLERCMKLQEIPYSFGSLSALEMIKVRRCSYSATRAAREIQEEQLDFGAAVKLHIQQEDWDS